KRAAHWLRSFFSCRFAARIKREATHALAGAPPSESDTQKLKRRNRELSILNAIAEALNREVDLSRALEVSLAQVAKLLDLQTGWIWLLREDSGESYLAATLNLPPALANAPQRMEGSCYCL